MTDPEEMRATREVQAEEARRARQVATAFVAGDDLIAKQLINETEYPKVLAYMLADLAHWVYHSWANQGEDFSQEENWPDLMMGLQALQEETARARGDEIE